MRTNSGNTKVVNVLTAKGKSPSRQCPKPKRKGIWMFSIRVFYDTNSSVQQDVMILSVFEQLLNQVTNCNKVNKDNLMANESLSAELERYKERFTDFEKEINSLKQTLSEQLKENELLTKKFNVLKNESKEKEAKNNDKEIDLEKKVKELDNIVYKMGQSAQHFGKRFVPQTELLVKQAFLLKSSLSSEEPSTYSTPVKTNVPKELPKTLKDTFNNFDQCLLDEIIEVQTVFNQMEQAVKQCHIVNIVVNSSVDLNTSMNVNSSVVMNDSVNYVEM
ncbi:hypothetical protein Tco_0218062 [Tanacetum coccineum]